MSNSLENLSVATIKFKKTKDKLTEHKKNYIMSNWKGERISITLTNVKIPFGYEKYNSTNILNMEIEPKKHNEHNNIYSYIKAFEKEFIDQDNIKFGDLQKEIDGKGYYPNMRESKGGYILRAYVFGNPTIYSMIKDFKNLLTSADIKQTIANVKLELGSLWVNDTNYGFVYYIKEIEVIRNYATAS